MDLFKAGRKEGGGLGYGHDGEEMIFILEFRAYGADDTQSSNREILEIMFYATRSHLL